MGVVKLKRCVKCHLQPSGVLTKVLKDKVHPLAKRYFVLCACLRKPLFDSRQEAVDAWNKANATAST
jgi:hypothetical protein